jgi:hypothetical protein
MDWLIFQLRYDFKPTIYEARKLTEKELDGQLLDLQNYMSSLNGHNRLLPVFLDGAQATLSMYQDCFPSSNQSINKPLYYGIAVGFTSIPGISFISCGTGLKLGDADRIILSRANKPTEDTKYIVCNTFDNRIDIDSYINELFPGFKLDEDEYAWFIGRVRFLATFMEFQLAQASKGMELLTVADYVTSVTTDTMNETTLARIFDKNRFGDSITESKAYSILQECVLHYIYLGKPMDVTSKESWLFEKSFGILVPGQLDYYIHMEEPLILKTAKNLIFGNCPDTDTYGGQTLEVLIQSKLRLEVSCVAGLKTTNPKKLLLQ